jgi:hypothetical protein
MTRDSANNLHCCSNRLAGVDHRQLSRRSVVGVRSVSPERPPRFVEGFPGSIVARSMANYRTCVFCGGTPTNNEDVIPRWLVRFLKPIPPATRRVGRTFADRTDLGSAVAQSVTGIGVGKLKAVCEHTCNNGWMKRLEDRTKPILRPMMKGAPASLNVDSQETLALWAAKTAMMLAIKYSKLPSMALRRPLYEQGEPPPTSIIWLSHIQPEALRVGTVPLLSQNHGDPSVRNQGFVARLVLANVGFVIFGNPAPRRGRG